MRRASPYDVTIMRSKMAGTGKSRSLTPDVELSMVRAKLLVVKQETYVLVAVSKVIHNICTVDEA